jgi:hypothetical protein
MAGIARKKGPQGVGLRVWPRSARPNARGATPRTPHPHPSEEGALPPPQRERRRARSARAHKGPSCAPRSRRPSAAPAAASPSGSRGRNSSQLVARLLSARGLGSRPRGPSRKQSFRSGCGFAAPVSHAKRGAWPDARERKRARRLSPSFATMVSTHTAPMALVPPCKAAASRKAPLQTLH